VCKCRSSGNGARDRTKVFKMILTITENQRALLRAFNDHDYSWCDKYSSELIGDGVYQFAVTESFSPSSRGGIIAGAESAGLIECVANADRWPIEYVYALTELGYKALLIIDNQLKKLAGYEWGDQGSNSLCRGVVADVIKSNDLWNFDGRDGLIDCPDKVDKRLKLLFIVDTDLNIKGAL
jgi:hypothetical protein